MSEDYINYNYKMPVGKEKQKKLITEIMNEDQKDGLYEKQTAVEWLVEYIKGISSLNHDEIIKQAKQMEKEQIIDSMKIAFTDGIQYGQSIREYNSPWKSWEQYYEDNYGGNK